MVHLPMAGFDEYWLSKDWWGAGRVISLGRSTNIMVAKGNEKVQGLDVSQTVNQNNFYI